MHPSDWAKQCFLASKMLGRLSSSIPGFRRHEPEGRMVANLAANDFRNYVKLRPPSPAASPDGYVEFWAERWLDKWRERVKLVFGQQDAHVFARHERMVREVAQLWRSLPQLPEALELVLDALIDVGELCFTNLLAETALRAELMEVKRASRSMEEALRRVQRDAIPLVKAAAARARGYKYVRGHLVWLRVNESVWRGSYGRIVETPVEEGGVYGAVDL